MTTQTLPHPEPLIEARWLRSVLAFILSLFVNVSFVVSLAELDAPENPKDEHEAHQIRPSVVEPPPPQTPDTFAPAPQKMESSFLSAPDLPSLDLPAMDSLSDGPSLQSPLGLDGLGLELGDAWTLEPGSAQDAPSSAPPTPDRAPQMMFIPDLARFYPRQARRRGLGGRSIVQVEVDARGRVTQAEILESQPPGVFDDAALRAARSFTFEPARRGTEATAGQTRLELTWQPRR